LEASCFRCSRPFPSSSLRRAILPPLLVGRFGCGSFLHIQPSGRIAFRCANTRSPLPGPCPCRCDVPPFVSPKPSVIVAFRLLLRALLLAVLFLCFSDFLSRTVSLLVYTTSIGTSGEFCPTLTLIPAKRLLRCALSPFSALKM